MHPAHPMHGRQPVHVAAQVIASSLQHCWGVCARARRARRRRSASLGAWRIRMGGSYRVDAHAADARSVYELQMRSAAIELGFSHIERRKIAMNESQLFTEHRQQLGNTENRAPLATASSPLKATRYPTQ